MYIIKYELNVIKKDIPALSEPFKSFIKKAIEERLKVDPIGFGKPLRYSLKGHRRLRVGDYRIVYRIDKQNMAVIILTIQHRKDVYDQF